MSIEFDSLKENRDFTHLYKRGKSVSNKDIVIYYKKSKDKASRVGFSISKKVGNSVRRHRLKRLMKEVYRLECDYFKGYDVVFVAKIGNQIDHYQEMLQAIMSLIGKIKMKQS